MKRHVPTLLLAILGLTFSAVSAADAPLAISAGDLAKAFKADKAAAAKYTGKLLEVTGTVRDPAFDDGSNAGSFTLTGIPEAMMGGYHPRFLVDKKMIKTAVAYTRGQQLTIQANCKGNPDGMGMFIDFDGTTILKTGPDPALVISAADLAKACAADADAAAKKYEGQQVQLEGKVLTIDEKEYEVVLEGAGAGDKAITIHLRVGYDGWHIAKTLKVGQTIKAKGECAYHESSHTIEIANTTRLLVD